MTDEELKDRLRYTIKHGLFRAVENGMSCSFSEILNRIEELEAKIEEQAKAIRATALGTLQKQGQEFTRIYELQDRIEELESTMATIRELAVPTTTEGRTKSKRERLILIANAVDGDDNI